MEWSVQEIARLSGTTSRTLRHYHEIGLLRPSRVGANRYRYYDEEALLRLQRILLLREMGMGLAEIAGILRGQKEHVRALRAHLVALRRDRVRLDDRIRSVERTIERLEKGEALMPEEMLNGFDPAKYRDEVIERWGRDAWSAGDRWWRGMSTEERMAWTARSSELIDAWRDAAARDIDPRGEEARALAARQAEWLGSIPGTPRSDARPTKEYYLGLAEMYVADERFARNYGGVKPAGFVRDAMTAWAEGQLL